MKKYRYRTFYCNPCAKEFDTVEDARNYIDKRIKRNDAETYNQLWEIDAGTGESVLLGTYINDRPIEVLPHKVRRKPLVKREQRKETE